MFPVTTRCDSIYIFNGQHVKCQLQTETVFLSPGMLFTDQTDETLITELERHMYSHKTSK